MTQPPTQPYFQPEGAQYPPAAPFGGQAPFDPAAGMMPAAPVRKKRTGLKIFLGLFAVVVVLCVGVGAVVAMPIMKEYPATITMPDQLAGLTKSTDAQQTTQATQLADELKTESGADTALAGYYTSGAHPDQITIVIAATKLIISPDSEIDSAKQTFVGTDFTIDGYTDEPAGDLGGSAICGTGKATAEGTTMPLVTCFWADHGSVGAIIFMNQSGDSLKEVFQTIRTAVEHRD